jgi:hypothetical protein
MTIVKKLLGSRKFVAALIATVTFEKALGAVSPMLVYIGAR